jgi:hypothetical protein
MSIKIPIVSDFDSKGIKRAIAEFQQLETVSQKAQFAIKKAAVPAAAALTGLFSVTLKAAQAAGDLNEAQNAANVLFGQAAKDITAFSKQASKSLGLSEIAAIQAATAFAGLGKSAGLQGDDLANFSKRFTTLAADMASFMNTSPEDAIMAIGAAMRGETEPIRRYNVLLDDMTLRTRAVKLGLISSVKEGLTPANKALAAQAEILEQTSYMHGDFAKTSDGAAGQQKILKAELDNLTRSLGQSFIPALENTLPKLTALADWAADNPKAISNAAIAVGGLAGATLALNAAMSVNPYVAAAAGIVAMGAAFDQLYKEVDKVNKIGGIGARILGVLFGGPAGAMSGLNKVREGVWSLFGVTGKATDSMAGLNKAQIENAEINKLVADGLINLNKAETSFTATTTKGTSAVDKRLAKIKELRKEITSDFKSALESAKDVLEDSQKAFVDFGSSISDSITSGFSFSAAQQAGKETGMSFLDALAEQVGKTRDFAVKINRLLAAGLSETALQQVLAAGQEAGGAIADELLAGGADAIAQANALTSEVQTLADNVGLNAATQFKQTGVDAGTALVAGIMEAISTFKLELKSKKLTPKQLARLQKDFGLTVDFLLSGGQSSIPALANGGVVKASPGGTLALIGEGGRDEAVIPLDRAGGMGGTNVTIHVNGGDPNAVVDALRRYMRTNGAVPIRVSTSI